MHLLKIGTVQYLNSKILNYGFHLIHSKQKIYLDNIRYLSKYQYHLIEDTPSNLVELLLKQSIDIGLISTIEALRNQKIFSYYPYLGICSFKEVQSILYIKKDNHFHRPVKKIYLDVSSRTSVALLKILYYKTFQEHPEYCLETPENILKKIDKDSAGLLIGDPAIEVFLNPNSFYFKDLATWWYEYTSLPFVFGVWSFLKTLSFSTQIFEESYQLGVEHIKEIIEYSSYPKDYVTTYLTKIIYYRINEQERKSIQLFETYLREMDLI